MKLKSPLIIASFLLTVSSLFAQTMPKNELVFLTSDWFGAGYIRPADECYGTILASYWHRKPPVDKHAAVDVSTSLTSIK